jgi:hypothetical protein
MKIYFLNMTDRHRCKSHNENKLNGKKPALASLKVSTAVCSIPLMEKYPFCAE